jgi:hypothetical protein
VEVKEELPVVVIRVLHGASYPKDSPLERNQNHLILKYSFAEMVGELNKTELIGYSI